MSLLFPSAFGNVITMHPRKLAILPLMLLATTASGREYAFEYGVQAGYEYNDNVGLTPEEEVDISGGQIDVPVNLSMRTERLEAALAGSLGYARFNEDDYDSDYQFLEARSKYQLENGEIEGAASYREETTRESEFLDTGRVGSEASEVDTIAFEGAGLHMFTAKNGITGGVAYEDVDYESDFYQDYEFLSGYLGWVNRWDERLSFRLQGYGNQFDNEGDIEIESTSWGAETGFDYQVSERLDMQLLVGWVWIDTEYSTQLPVTPEDDESDGLQLEGALTYTRERYELEARVTSGPSPSGNGYLLYADQLDLAYRYGLTEHHDCSLGMTVGQSESVDDRLSTSRDYAQISAGLAYEFTSEWSLQGIYEYSYQDQTFALGAEPGDADSNAVYITVIYKPEKTIWSR